MANVRPFKGISYDIGGHDLSAVTTPPYDQISPEAVREFHGKDPHSYIRLILAEKGADDTETENRYTRARDTLKEWLDEGVLVRDDQEAFYVYQQSFEVLGRANKRTGLMAAVHHEDPDNGKILRHERTLPKHVDDRLSLLRETRTQFESIFLLYDDPERETHAAVEVATGEHPLLAVTDDIGTEHRIWRLRDPNAIGKLMSFFSDRVLLIADGHHRYQTTGLYEKETGREADGWVLATLVPVDDPGLVILPTHRLVKSVTGYDAEKLHQALQEDFNVESFDGNADAMTAELRKHAGHGHRFGWFDGDRNWLLTLRDEQRLSGYAPEGHTVAWMKLDVAILHCLILEKLLGISMDAVAREGNLEYVRWPSDAVGAVRSGRAQAAFFLNATLPAQVRDLATKGELMPQKSTDFYPKLLSGLVAFQLPEVASETPPPRRGAGCFAAG